MDWSYIAKLIVSVGSIGTIIVYLGRRFIDKSLEAGLEMFKSSLDKELETHKSALSRETEQFNAKLKIAELEHQIKYNRLHEERALIVKTLHGLIIDLQTDLSNFTSFYQGPEWIDDQTKENKAGKSLEDFKEYFLRNRIYFNIALCNKIDEVLRLSWEIIVEMRVTRLTAMADVLTHKADAVNKWKVLDERVREEINSARLDLETEFRKLIGVD